MDPLPIGLTMIDDMHGGHGMRRLYEGWTGREPRHTRLRILTAHALRTLAARLAPALPPTPAPARDPAPLGAPTP